MLHEHSLTDQLTQGHITSPVFAARTHPSVYYGFCCGDALPVVDSVPEGGRAHYTACPLWRKRREADWARQRQAYPDIDRASVYPYGREPRRMEVRNPDAEAQRVVEEMALGAN